MSIQSELNLIGVFSPVCLMRCKSELNTMQSGDYVDVLIADPEVADELEKIIKPSNDKVIHRRKESDHYRIRILRG